MPQPSAQHSLVRRRMYLLLSPFEEKVQEEKKTTGGSESK